MKIFCVITILLFPGACETTGDLDTIESMVAIPGGTFDMGCVLFI